MSAEQRMSLWHQYWLNAMGCFVGCVAVRFIWSRRASLQAVDFAILGFIAFLGLTGFLPMAAVGLARGLQALAEKLLGSLIR
jgi:sorbitol-specific phosphotransferase system component IIBC